MKWTAYCFVLWLMVLSGPAVQAQVSWGVMPGGSLVSFYPHQQPYQLTQHNQGGYSLISAWMAGLVAEAPAGRRWLFDASLSYDGQGSHAVYEINTPDISQTTTLTIRLAYLRLPIQAIYQLNPGRKIRIMTGGGFYAGLALGGQEKGSALTIRNIGMNTRSIDNGISMTNDPSTQNGAFYPSAVKPFDCGYTVMAGIQWPHLRLSPSFSQGFVNLFPGGTFKGKNKSISLSLIYWITSPPSPSAKSS